MNLKGPTVGRKVAAWLGLLACWGWEVPFDRREVWWVAGPWVAVCSRRDVPIVDTYLSLYIESLTTLTMVSGSMEG